MKRFVKLRGVWSLKNVVKRFPLAESVSMYDMDSRMSGTPGLLESYFKLYGRPGEWYDRINKGTVTTHLREVLK